MSIRKVIYLPKPPHELRFPIMSISAMFEKVVTEHGLSETEFWTSVIGTEGGIESTIQRTVWIDDDKH